MPTFTIEVKAELLNIAELRPVGDIMWTLDVESEGGEVICVETQHLLDAALRTLQVADQIVALGDAIVEFDAVGFGACV